MTRTLVRLLLGFGLTAAGALALREAWWPVVGWFALVLGSAVLVGVAWRWLERDRNRLLRWSDEHRLRALSRAFPAETHPIAGSAVNGLGSVRPDHEGAALPEPVRPVGAGHPAD
ncbi:MAG TPA: hypothetical protein VKD90_06530 [Gemmataceae bacterium]|nr:hypothetical protein [Gemmataceae bacterium]